ncbi:hypothetical protein IU433_03160 [Nocardia puris]|uniref:Uncharacterized protein n=1 Tax=Nocardia puris TaxID=208602 RepID=A0A366DY54_9NOCA|nr:hypothetical protein [Nocardia puris]MBF6210048.1 hypothetical protein [Nocardia puris]MBF6368239.1 hypothetical protein [Nocardia puris]MBF6458042.1 hypothetical protein [Nocardia puris]RBO94204.1 hypothetical protein DFR74_102627 [Nocardia puris]
MRTENINRKLKLHEERRATDRLPEQLQGFEIVEFVREDEFSPELLKSLAEFTGGAVAPHSRIYRNAQAHRIDEWVLALLTRARIGERLYLRTGLEYFPWVDCRVVDHRWLESLRRVFGPDQAFIAHDKYSAAATVGAQYEVLGYVAPEDLAHAPLPDPEPAGSDAPTSLLPALGDMVAPDAETELIRRIEPLPAGDDPT